MKWFKSMFRRKTFKPQPKSLRVDGVKTVLTPKPDDAELAAQALLEKLSEKGNKAATKEPEQGTVEYYREMSKRIKANKAAERRLTMRYLTYCEEQLALPKPLYNGQIDEMEQELYKRQDVADREGGELLRRWQHCLAECIVRQMTTADEDENKTEQRYDKATDH